MTWAKLDDQLHSHPKARRAGFEAMGLWVLGLSHCVAYLTDGSIEECVVVALVAASGYPAKRAAAVASNLAARLVAAGLWDVIDGGWQYHDWDSFQPTRAAVIEARAAKQRAGRKGGISRAVALARAQADASAGVQANAQAESKLRARDPDPVPSDLPLTPAERGDGLRGQGLSPRALGTNPRALAATDPAPRLRPDLAPPPPGQRTATAVQPATPDDPTEAA